MPIDKSGRRGYNKCIKPKRKKSSWRKRFQTREPSAVEGRQDADSVNGLSRADRTPVFPVPLGSDGNLAVIIRDAYVGMQISESVNCSKLGGTTDSFYSSRISQRSCGIRVFFVFPASAFHFPPAHRKDAEIMTERRRWRKPDLFLLFPRRPHPANRLHD